MKTLKILLFAFIITLTSCIKIFNKDDDYDFTYETIVTELPVNLENINSTFDDYNSNLPYPGFRQGIYFSTNRNSSGNNFDIIHKSLDISYHPKDDILNISFVSDMNSNNEYANKVLETINSEFDEFGPFYFFSDEAFEYFFYANNESGDFDIKYASTKKLDFGTYSAKKIINEPKSFVSINSGYDDMYPCIFSGNKSLVFCSNREMGIFNIYESTFKEDAINPNYQSAITQEIIKVNALSSDFNDKCPFVLGNIMVFTSDREGGYGGFDLYFSQYLNGKWSQPQNLGDKINSEYDEYRPIIVPFGEFDDTMLIFSSNKPGGKGGFDLYAARTKTLPKLDSY
ncbi:MAG: hypothetical protein K0M50_02175 [Prolixibacteraceae bacterium]|nr:hypothetical protein [Prolixibacteraceae bacterium]